MEEKRTTFIGKVKQLLPQIKNAIEIVILIIVGIALFIGGYLISWNFITNPLDDTQLEICEQIAQDVYTQNGTGLLVEVPKGYTVFMTNTDITVRVTGYSGQVTASLQNGELVTTREPQTVLGIIESTAIGVLCAAVVMLIIIQISKHSNK